MCDPVTVSVIATLASAGTTVYGAQKQKNSIRKSGKFNQEVSAINESLALGSASNSLIKGQQLETISRVNTEQLVANQRTGFASSGIVVGEGSSADIIDQSIALGELDALIIRDNAVRESDSFKREAEAIRLGGELAESRTKSQTKAVGLQAANQLFQLAI